MRKCSHCSQNGHNSRTCPNRGVLKLFGVRLTDGIRKTASMGNLAHYVAPSDGSDHGDVADGYASEGFVPDSSSSSSRDRKKGVPWTEEEHRMFLFGLQKLGKGDWKGISRNFVVSRTPTQVASHAQKYFIRQSNASRRKRRSSLFDIVAEESAKLPESVPSLDNESHGNTPLLEHPSVEECESMNSTIPCDQEVLLPTTVSYPVAFPVCLQPAGFFPFSLCSDYAGEPPPIGEPHQIIRPIPVHSKAPLNIDRLLGISDLSIGESTREPILDLSIGLSGPSHRQSAFHTNLSASSTHMHSSFSPVPAI